MVTHVNSRPDEQYQFSKVVKLGPPIHQSKLSNENCNILQRLTISKFCRNGSIYTLNKHYLNIQTISGIKYFCLRGVPGKTSNSEVIEGERKYSGTKMLDQALMMSIISF